MGKPRAFTLIELLIVVAIIALVSVLAIKTISASILDLQMTSAASEVQAAIHLARDSAAATGLPSGFRLVPDDAFPVSRLPNGQADPTAPLAYSAIVPLETPHVYSEGLVTINPYSASNPFPIALPSNVLVLEQSPTNSDGTMANPTGWFWNLRIGEKVTVGAGKRYTIVGPVVQANPEGCVNIGPMGTTSPLVRGGISVEYLFLVNGLDDDGDGFADNGYDGLPAIYPRNAFETEQWESGLASGISAASYSVQRRPIPASNGKTVYLPGSVVIDATAWTQPLDHLDVAKTVNRSQLPVDPVTGQVDVVIDAGGRMVPAPGYSVPSSVSMTGRMLVFWIGLRGDLGNVPTSVQLVTFNGKTGAIGTFDPAGLGDPLMAGFQR